MFHALFRVPVVTARIFMTYGPGQRDLTKLVPYVIVSLLQGQAPRLTSGGRLVDWIHVDDVVDGLVALALAPAVERRTIDLGSGALVSIRAVVEHLVTLTGSPLEPLFGAVPDRALELTRAADTTAAYARLSWKPAISLADGLARTVDWHRRQLNHPQPAQAEGNAT
jgi:UDP-glucose 4-epimerase